jgi:hypothetical protein
MWAMRRPMSGRTVVGSGVFSHFLMSPSGSTRFMGSRFLTALTLLQALKQMAAMSEGLTASVLS